MLLWFTIIVYIIIIISILEPRDIFIIMSDYNNMLTYNPIITYIIT